MACGHSDGKGAKVDVFGLAGASVGVGLACYYKRSLATHNVGPGSSSKLEQAEMSLNVTLYHNTTKF